MNKRILFFWILFPLFFLVFGVLVYFYSDSLIDGQKNNPANRKGELKDNFTQNDEKALDVDALHQNANAYTESTNNDNDTDLGSATPHRHLSGQPIKDHSGNGNLQYPNVDSQNDNIKPSQDMNNLADLNATPQQFVTYDSPQKGGQFPASADTVNESNTATRPTGESLNLVQLKPITEQTTQQPYSLSLHAVATDSIERLENKTELVSSHSNDQQTSYPPVSSPLSKFFVGGLFTVMRGKNFSANSELQLAEQSSFNGFLEVGFRLNKSLALVSGLNYQTRREIFQFQNVQIDSNFAGVEIQYIYEPNNPIPVDSIFIDFFNFDSTITNAEQRGSWRQYGIPLFLDWTIYERNKFSFGFQAGTVLSMASFKSFDASNNPLEQWSKFSNQWLFRPYFYYHLGPWRIGVHLSTQYDLVLPQSWGLQNRKRYAYGLGFGIRYQFPAR